MNRHIIIGGITLKRNLFTVFCILLVFTLLFATTGSVAAAPLNDGPSIYSSTDDSVTATIIEISKLPGTVKLDNGAIYPVGFENGSRVFSGLGMKVSDLNGSAVIHMPVKNYTYGWTGSIYQYAFGGWIEVPTVITKDNESADGTASATIYYDGIYAVLVHYVAPVIQKDEGPTCPAYEPFLFYTVDTDNQEIGLMALFVLGEFTNFGLINEEIVPVTVVSDNPEITFISSTPEEAWLFLFEDASGVYGFAAVMVEPSEEMATIEYTGEGLPYFTITVEINGCSFSYSVNEDNFETGGPY
mgnify:CR=1 FL=1